MALRNAAYRDYHLASQVPDMEEKTEDDDGWKNNDEMGVSEKSVL